MAQEYYSEIKLVDTNSPRLDLIKTAGAGAPPKEMVDLIRQIESVQRVIRALFQNDSKQLTAFFRNLHLVADSGLRGQDYSVETGLENLEELKNSIADSYPSVRKRIWLWDVGMLLGMVLICALIAGGWRYYSGSWQVDLGSPALNGWAFAVPLVPLGVTVGLFLEFFFRASGDLSYEQLRNINPGRWKPFESALNTTIVGFVFATVLTIGIFQVGAFNVLLNEFTQGKPWLAGVIGFMSGFAFPQVRDLIQQIRPVRRDGNATS